jgi:hypothetical protein
VALLILLISAVEDDGLWFSAVLAQTMCSLNTRHATRI